MCRFYLACLSKYGSLVEKKLSIGHSPANVTETAALCFQSRLRFQCILKAIKVQTLPSLHQRRRFILNEMSCLCVWLWICALALLICLHNVRRNRYTVENRKREGKKSKEKTTHKMKFCRICIIRLYASLYV